MNNTLVIISGVVIASLVVTSIFLTTDINQLMFQDEPVVITMDLWAGYAHTFIAQEKEFFDGVNVEFQVHSNIQENIELFKNGKVDGMFGLQSDAILLAAEGIPLKIVYVPNISNGGDVLVSDLQIKTINDLKGKRVSVEYPNSFNHIFLVELLKQNGLQETDVEIVSIPGDKVPDALESGLIDAGQTWEPFKSQAIANGYRLLATSADVPGIITDVLIFNPKIIEERPDDIKKIIIGLFRALEFRDTNPFESYHIMSKAFEVSPSSLKESIEGNMFPNLKENKEAFVDSEQLTSLYNSGEIISDFFIAKGVIDKPVNIDSILASEIINEITIEKLDR